MTKDHFKATNPPKVSRRGIQTVHTAAVGTILMAVTGTATLGAAVGKIVLGIAVSALQRKKRGKANVQSPGIKTDVTTTGDVTPQSFILGKYATAGNHVAPAMTSRQHGDWPNAELIYVVDLSDMPITNLARVIVDGEYIPLVTTPNPDGFLAAQGRLAGYFGVKFLDGTQTQADPYLISRYGTYPERPWTADMVGTGIPYAILYIEYNRKLYNGLPQVKFEVEGVPLYDPRKDGSIGGSGAHRWDNPSTWEYSDNPAVMVYNLLRGITLPDGSLYGLGASFDEVPLSHAVAAMNICDQVPTGRSAAQYRAGYEVKIGTAEDGGEDPMTVIDELLKACDGDVAEVGGNWYMRAGGAGLPVMSITDFDIVRNRPQDLDPFPSLGETINILHASGPTPDSLWEVKDAPSRELQDAIEEDGQRLSDNITLPAVWDRIQVQQLMLGWLKDARRFVKHNITLMPHAVNLMPLDVIRWTSERNGYDQKDFEIDQRGLSTKSLAITLAIREVDPNDTAWGDGDEIPEVIPSPASVPPAQPTLPGFIAQPLALRDDNDDERRPAIRFIWNTNLPDVTAILYTVREKVTGQIVANGSTNNVADGSEVISSGLLPNIDYEIRANVQSARETNWTPWQTVRTPAAYINGGDISVGSLDEVSDSIGTFRSATSGERVEISDDVIKVFDAAGVARIIIGRLT